MVHEVGDSPERIVAAAAWSGLASRRLSFLGLTDGGPGYHMQRPRPDAGHVVISFGGGGQVWCGGRWQSCSAGQAYLTPASVPMGFRTVGRRRWQFAWAYLPSFPDLPEPVSVLEPALTNIDPRPIVNAIEGLYLEVNGAARIARVELWADLVNRYIRELAAGGDESDPLWRLWAEVDARLGETWTLPRLAELAGHQPEALRRIALRTVGRSPMKQVTHLRMRRAEALLRATSDKLYNIARQVGYQNVFAFSTAFRRWNQQSPKSVRDRCD